MIELGELWRDGARSRVSYYARVPSIPGKRKNSNKGIAKFQLKLIGIWDRFKCIRLFIFRLACILRLRRRNLYATRIQMHKSLQCRWHKNCNAKIPQRFLRQCVGLDHQGYCGRSVVATTQGNRCDLHPSWHVDWQVNTIKRGRGSSDWGATGGPPGGNLRWQAWTVGTAAVCVLARRSPATRLYRPVNERLRLDKNVNKAFSPEMGSLMAYYTPKNSPPKSSHGKASFSPQIQDGRHYIGSNIQMGLILEPGNIETHLRCHFQLTLGCPFA